tara:strand:+ start:506 stop:859 length:354 start_codon:yes stop_codon:yes gene_type:complete
MKITNKQLKQIIKEELEEAIRSSGSNIFSKMDTSGIYSRPQQTSASGFSPTEIYMDLMRRGGPDYWLSEAHGRPMKCTSDVHYGQALRAYIDETDPSLNDMPNNIWSQITELMRNTN